MIGVADARIPHIDLTLIRWAFVGKSVAVRPMWVHAKGWI